MAGAQNVITIAKSIIFDRDFLEDGRYVITNAEMNNIPSDAFVDGVVEVPVLFVSNSILAIRPGAATVVLDNLPDNLEFIHQSAGVLYFVIKGDCDITLIKVQDNA